MKALAPQEGARRDGPHGAGDPDALHPAVLEALRADLRQPAREGDAPQARAAPEGPVGDGPEPVGKLNLLEPAVLEGPLERQAVLETLVHAEALQALVQDDALEVLAPGEGALRDGLEMSRSLELPDS